MQLTLTDSEIDAVKKGLELAISITEDDIDRAKHGIPDRSVEYAKNAALLRNVRERLGPIEPFDAHAWLAKLDRQRA